MGHVVGTIRVEPLDATFGAVVRDVVLAQASDATIAELSELWLEYALLLFPGQHMSPHEQDEFARRFGDLEFAATPLTNIQRDGTLRSTEHDLSKSLRGNERWHHDSTYMPVQAKGAVFTAEIVPDEGGDTGFADMRAAYDALDDATRERVGNLAAYHSRRYSMDRAGLHVSDENADRYQLSAWLDLREDKGKEILRGLIRNAHVFSQGYRPGTLADRGFSPEALAQLRPGIVAVSLCAFSHAGPWASRRGFDTVIQSVSGITWRQGEVFPGKEPGPQFYPVSAIDFLTGYLMAFGAMHALARRAREGGSWLVRISLAQVGRWLVERGQVPEAELGKAQKEFTADELARWSMTSDVPEGKLQHLGPTLRMSETPPRWVRPTVPLGHHPPEWPR